MIGTFSPPRPATLIYGRPYHRLERDPASGAACSTIVHFVAYTASPAFVVVSQGDKRLRCPRADLFDLAGAPASAGRRYSPCFLNFYAK
jgi:hypothetical protein